MGLEPTTSKQCSVVFLEAVVLPPVAAASEFIPAIRRIESRIGQLLEDTIN